MNPTVSAIVLSYGGHRARESVRCVQALREQTVADQIEILVVDNHSLDDSIGILRNRLEGIPTVRIIEAPNHLGYGKGNNYGVRYAFGKYLLIINPDNLLPPDGLEKLIDILEQDSSIGVLAPQLVYPDGTRRDSFRKFPAWFDVFIKRTFLKYFFKKRMRSYTGSHEQPSALFDVDWIAGACLLFRTDFYKELGGFDPRFFLFFEDIDLCRRIWAAGKRVVFCADVIAMDRKERLSEGGVLTFFTKWTVRCHVRSAIKYYWKWGMRV